MLPGTLWHAPLPTMGTCWTQGAAWQGGCRMLAAGLKQSGVLAQAIWGVCARAPLALNDSADICLLKTLAGSKLGK